MREIFVFGSNMAGRHGKGAALHARKHHGAVYGQGIGLQGDSYAIPTKGEVLEVLPLTVIQKHVADFVAFAKDNPDLSFRLTAVGCGLAGFKPSQIAPMFASAPDNVIRPPEFKDHTSE